jgi:hypothetical protein
MGRNHLVSAHYHALGGVHGTELMFAGAAGIGTGTRTGTATTFLGVLVAVFEREIGS